jgi:hypothetical protein
MKHLLIAAALAVAFLSVPAEARISPTHGQPHTSATVKAKAAKAAKAAKTGKKALKKSAKKAGAKAKHKKAGKKAARKG